ncbi:unnamed protein product [Coffea canephora]|uniref:DH200=94 genomic scaffold, scaffold_133 n=1 Tax=Coffea canephora TaxID=49390 RepID=A0A068V7D7_COFCA|nr:unnamed protein product [Coffea canephora]CDP16586.1 unnamed protein product [Coffea canephora]
MDFAYSGDGSSDEASVDTGKKKEQFRRHSAQQIQRLEAFFKTSQHPTKDEKQQLSTELGLSSGQIKFWFQNKRNQIRLRNEREENDALIVENEKLRMENLMLGGMLMDPFCTKCHGGLTEEETRKLHLQGLANENAKMKKEVDSSFHVFELSKILAMESIFFFSI